MTDPRWQQQWELFHAALEKEPGERDAFLRKAAADDEQRNEVLALLAAHERDAGALDRSPLLAGQPGLETDAEALVGQTIDHYRITRLIGEGGMGVVYEAEQRGPVSRTVALKLIKLGMSTREVVARFQQERQALAMMNHPNIAQVHDAGATSDGRPYFVMERVEGEPITTFCDREQLGMRARLGLCIDVLAGIQHAHQKGLVHRDIKPSNILVSRGQDGTPRLKIIDFGIAKATDARAVEHTMYTVAGRLIGTPAYMSPEQATLTGAGMDTRSDLYSISVLLYELLTGALPFPSESLLSAGYAEMQRIICEDDPPTPSKRLGSLDAETLTGVAASRGKQARSLARELAGDLDWIVMKGLEKDPARRYATATEFAADLDRYLNNLPVAARAPSATYRAGKFVRRHRTGVAVAALSLLALLLFLGTTLWQSKQLAAALQSAQVEQRKAEQVTGFLIEILGETDPNNALGEDVTVKAAMDRGAERLQTALTDEPEIRVAVLVQMAEIYRELGEYDAAASLLDLAVKTIESMDNPDSANLVEVNQVRANLQHDQGNYDSAMPLYEETLRLQRALDPRHPHVVRALKDFGVLHIDTGDFTAAASMLQEAVTLGRQIFPDGDKLLVTSIGSLAYALYQDGDNAAAAPLFDEAIAMEQRLFGNRTLEYAYLLSNFGNFQREQGNLQRAIDAQLEVAEIYREVLGDKHPYHATAMINLGSAYSRAGQLEAAEQAALKSVALHEAIFDSAHPNKASAYYQLAVVQRKRNRLDEAARNFRAVLEIDIANLGEQHPYVFSDLEQLSVVLKQQGKLEDAEKYQRQALEGRINVLGPDHPDTAAAHLNLSGVLGLQGDDDGSLAEAQRAVDILSGEEPDNLHRVAAQTALASALHRAGRYAEAESIYMDLLANQRRNLPAEHPNLAQSLHGIGVARLAMGQPATEVLEEALAIREASQGANHPDTILTRDALEKSRRTTSN